MFGVFGVLVRRGFVERLLETSSWAPYVQRRQHQLLTLFVRTQDDNHLFGDRIVGPMPRTSQYIALTYFDRIFGR